MISTHAHPELQPIAPKHDATTAMTALAGAYRRFLARGCQPLQNVTASNVTEPNRTRPKESRRTRADIARQRHEVLRLWRETTLTTVEIAMQLDVDRGTVSTWVHKAGLSRANARSYKKEVA